MTSANTPGTTQGAAASGITQPQGHPPQTADRPGRATPTAAAVIAIVMGAFYAVGVFGFLVSLIPHVGGGIPPAGYGYFALAVSAVTAALLLAGGVLLLARKSMGRLVVVGGCALNLASYLGSAIFMGKDYSPVMIAGQSLLSLLQIVVIVLALAPTTRRWIESKPSS